MAVRRKRIRVFRREPDLIDDAHDTRNIADVELGAGTLIGQVNNPGQRHPAVFNVNFEPVSRNREIPMQSVETRIRTSSLCDCMCLLPTIFSIFR